MTAIDYLQHPNKIRHFDGIMETLSGLLALCERNPQVTHGFPSQRVSNVELWYFLCSQPKPLFYKQASCLIWCHDANVTSLRWKRMVRSLSVRGLLRLLMLTGCSCCSGSISSSRLSDFPRDGSISSSRLSDFPRDGSISSSRLSDFPRDGSISSSRLTDFPRDGLTEWGWIISREFGDRENTGNGHLGI